MSRTIRRKNETQEYYWVLRDMDAWRASPMWSSLRSNIFTLAADSKQGKKELNRFHSDAGTHKCMEPGPTWYRRITRQVPLRRQGKEQLRQYMLNEEMEVLIDENPPLEYWT